MEIYVKLKKLQSLNTSVVVGWEVKNHAEPGYTVQLLSAIALHNSKQRIKKLAAFWHCEFLL